jgi:2-polyprenyl-3-methyl-5-hydroxy-6-metoxy-1,4-benzoquinol methylase
MAKGFLQYNYPQIIFAKQISGYLLNNKTALNTIIDCPCGNGETSYNIAKFTGAAIIGADLSPEAIQKAKMNFSLPQLSFEVNTIESVLNTHQQFDAFCLINSLFLLEAYDHILKQLKQTISANKAQLLIIIPNTEGKNFQWFQAQNTNENKLIIKEPEIESFFKGYGFTVNVIKPICYTHHYNRTDIRLLSVFWSLYLNFLNRIQTFAKIGKAKLFFYSFIF